jgi:hypothetical protein
MKYATWELDFTDPNYGTGPEEKIVELGFKATGAWVNGTVENGATILGYVYGEPSETELTTWNFTYLTQEEALDFCKAIDSKAYLLESGEIGVPEEELDTPSELEA